MVFELGQAGSVLGGLQHEIAQPNNPKNEQKMDFWNNEQGRKIAEQIKKEYTEKKFESLSS